jgi:hypothetical protein
MVSAEDDTAPVSPRPNYTIYPSPSRWNGNEISCLTDSATLEEADSILYGNGIEYQSVSTPTKHAPGSNRRLFAV